MQHPRLALVAGAAALAMAVPAGAQMNMPGMMQGMKMPGMKMPATNKAAPPKKGAAAKKKSTPRQGATKATKPGAKKTRGPSAKPGQDMSNMPGMAMPPPRDMTTMPGMRMPAQPPPGQNQSNMPGMQMPGMQMPGMQAPQAAAGTDLPAGNAPPPPLPADHAADAIYGAGAMTMGREHLRNFHGGQKLFQVFNNIMEFQARGGRDGYQWDSQAWYGGDINRLWLKSEGGGAFGSPPEKVEAQALYSHAIDPYFNLQGGIRYDFRPHPSRVYAALGIGGLAPSFFELEAFAFLSNKGELMARVEGFYDQRITQRLILQPRAEFNFAAQNSRDIGIGAGLSDAEVGIRLRYDIRREFAPYVGVQYSRAFGRTRDFLRARGEGAGNVSFLAGIRTWF